VVTVSHWKDNTERFSKPPPSASHAKDLQELLSLQTRYVQSQMRWYADQTQEFGQLMAGALGSVEASAGAVVAQTLTHVDPPEDVTSLKLTGFSIEVDTDPVTLLMQTDKGPFSVEISKTKLSNLVYALQIVSYADEPLQQKRLKRQAEARLLYGSVGDPTKAREATPIKSSRRAKERKGKKQK
jgi:Phasin protein